MSLCAVAQEADRLIVNSRAAAIEAEREMKRRNLKDEEPTKVERVLQAIKERKVLERVTAGIGGLRVRLGGLVTGSGFAAGPEYYRRFGRDELIVRSSIRGSLRKFYLIDARAALPRLAGDRAFADFYAARRDYPHLDYYGPGPGSSESGRTGYRLEETSFEARAGWKPASRLRVGMLGRYFMVNVGPGRDRRYISSERVYSTPGIDHQANYTQAGPFIQFDYRDNPGGPRQGGNYVAQFTTYADRSLGAGTFRRLDVEAQQYIPFFNRRRVIALRGRGEFSEPRAGQFVPFYLQPTLGGSDELRGFRRFRFYDNNAIVMNAEYRWEVFSGMDMALFYDTGKVFHRWEDASLGGLEKSYGFGLRFNVRNDVFMRIDTGFGREGFQVWLKFGPPF